MSERVVEIDRLSCVRGGNEILSGISWVIERGRHWALLGSNGSGKTTLLKILTGYEWPTAGDVRVLGRHFGEYDLRELRKTIGWVSAAIEQRLPMRDTAVEIAASGFDASIGLYREPEAAEWERARQAIHQVGADAFANRAFGLLSQGEQQRVLIARSLVNDPALLVLDEPCAGLDPAAREHFLRDIERMLGQAAPPTVVLVTHHIEEIGPWVERVLVLKRGRTLAAGPVGETLTGDVMRQAFDIDCEVVKTGEQYRLTLRRGN